MPRLSRKENQDLTRRRLREAAGVEFARHGVGATSIDRITNAAGYSTGAFYSNYGTKRDLALELMAENCEFEIGAWKDLIQQEHDLDTLFCDLEKRFEAFVANRERRLLAAELRLEAERDPEFGKAYHAAFLKILGSVNEMVRSLCRAAGREDDVDTEYVAITLHALSHGLAFERSGCGVLEGHTEGEILTKALADMIGHPIRRKRNKTPLLQGGDHD